MNTEVGTADDIIALMSASTPEDKALVHKAYDFAAKAHEKHKRLSGEPYLVHLVETAKGLAQLGFGATTIAAGLLHDSVEDVGVTLGSIEEEFGKEIRFLVDGVTKLGAFKYRGTERHRESLRKLLIATSKDARVLIIKLMDRLHNMKTLDYVPEQKRRRIALETLEIYAPIAHRLGIGIVRQELEDLAFKYAFPKEYEQAKQLVTEREKETTERLETMSRKLKRRLADAGITHFELESRVKGLYSLWQKLGRKEGDITKIYDLAALRVIVDSEADCYQVLGLVHELWQPLPQKIKDYIAFPKPNGYRSIHTTVFAGDGGIVEVQIRTHQMHNEAQFGIASHVSYKEAAPSGTRPQAAAERNPSSFDWVKSLIPRFGRMRKSAEAAAPARTSPDTTRLARKYSSLPSWLAELGEDGEDPDLETSLRTDVFSHRVFVFTPQGDVVDLPDDATPIDFAYAIHSDIGDHTWGAKVNGKMVPLDTVLENGDIVNIETRKNAHPTQKWLEFAKTALARRHIRNALEDGKKS